MKSVPLDGGVLDVTYPSHLPERLVRRRLRLLALQGRARHRKGILLWSLAFLPQMPLMLTPLPNISVYYSLYRIWSHSRALKGSFMLSHGFSALDAKQLVDLRERLAQYDQLVPGSWPHKLVTGDRTYKEFFQQVFIAHNKRRLEQRLASMLQKSSLSNAGEHGLHGQDSSAHFMPIASGSDSGAPPPGHVAILDTGLRLYFGPSKELSSILQKTNGKVTEETITKVGNAFSVKNLLENYERAVLYLKKKKFL